MRRKLDTDTLGKMSDNEVEFTLKKIRMEIQSLLDSRRKRKSSYSHEFLIDAQTEYCYVKRESESRFRRKEAHKAYVESKPRQYEETLLH